MSTSKAARSSPGSRVDLAKSGVGRGREIRRAKTRHQHDRRAEEGDPGGQVDRLSRPARAASMSSVCSSAWASPTRSRAKLKQTPTGVFVGSIIASGEAEIGFQQVSELLALRRRRLRRPAAGGRPAVHHVLERHHRRREGSGRRQGAGQVHHRAGGSRGLQEARHGAGLTTARASIRRQIAIVASDRDIA